MKNLRSVSTAIQGASGAVEVNVQASGAGRDVLEAAVRQAIDRLFDGAKTLTAGLDKVARPEAMDKDVCIEVRLKIPTLLEWVAKGTVAIEEGQWMRLGKDGKPFKMFGTAGVGSTGGEPEDEHPGRVVRRRRSDGDPIGRMAEIAADRGRRARKGQAPRRKGGPDAT